MQSVKLHRYALHSSCRQQAIKQNFLYQIRSREIQIYLRRILWGTFQNKIEKRISFPQMYCLFFGWLSNRVKVRAQDSKSQRLIPQIFLAKKCTASFRLSSLFGCCRVVHGMDYGRYLFPSFFRLLSTSLFGFF